MITMLLGGLWHGAAMTFVVWGAMHGAALVITRLVQRLHLFHFVPPSIKRPLGICLTFHLVCAAWVFFRSDSVGTALHLFRSIAAGDMGHANIPLPIVAVLAVALSTHWMPRTWTHWAIRWFHAVPAPLQGATLVGAIVLIAQLANTDVAPFIYFQF